MSSKLKWDENSSAGILRLHFDVPEHNLPLADFIATATRTSEVLQGLNDGLFDGRLKYEILVLPPRGGTFLEVLGVVMASSVGLGVLWAFAESSIGKGFIEGLTGKPPTEWAKCLGETVRRKLLSSENTSLAPSWEDLDADMVRRFEAMLLVEILKAFLSQDASNLAKLGLTPRSVRKSFEARNMFFQTCHNNKDIKGLGFEPEDTFPIGRRDFSSLLVSLPPKEEVEEDLIWTVGIERIVVHSPVWNRDLQDRRGWYAKYDNGKEAFFTVDDEEFWQRRYRGDLHLQPDDNLKVQWAYVERRGKHTHCKVLRVLEFNDQKLADPLPETALSAILGTYAKLDNPQSSLFSD